MKVQLYLKFELAWLGKDSLEASCRGCLESFLLFLPLKIIASRKRKIIVRFDVLKKGHNFRIVLEIGLKTFYYKDFCHASTQTVLHF